MSITGEVKAMNEALRGAVNVLSKWYPLPWKCPDGEPEGAHLTDANGMPSLMLYWPKHPVEETREVELAAYSFMRALSVALAAPAEPQPSDENWWTPMALDVVRHARMQLPGEIDWINSITNGLLTAFNRGQDSVARGAAPPQQELERAVIESAIALRKGSPHGSFDYMLSTKLVTSVDALLAAQVPRTTRIKGFYGDPRDSR